jgi:hypothetical protein
MLDVKYEYIPEKPVRASSLNYQLLPRIYRDSKELLIGDLLET